MNIEEILNAKVSHESKGAVRYHLNTPVVVIESSFEIDNPYNGERVETAIIYGMEENTVEDVLDLLETRNGWPIEGTHCTHSHDCCGCYYADRPVVVKVGKFCYVTQTWSQNV